MGIAKRPTNKHKRRVKADFQGFDLDSLGSWVQMESNSMVGKLTYGGSYYRDIADTFRNDLDENRNVIRERIQGPFGDDSTYQQLGFLFRIDSEYQINLILILAVDSPMLMQALKSLKTLYQVKQDK